MELPIPAPISLEIEEFTEKRGCSLKCLWSLGGPVSTLQTQPWPLAGWVCRIGICPREKRNPGMRARPLQFRQTWRMPGRVPGWRGFPLRRSLTVGGPGFSQTQRRPRCPGARTIMLAPEDRRDTKWQSAAGCRISTEGRLQSLQSAGRIPAAQVDCRSNRGQPVKTEGAYQGETHDRVDRQSFLPNTPFRARESQRRKDSRVAIPSQRQCSVRLRGCFLRVVDVILVQSAQGLPERRSLLRATLGCRISGTPGELSSLPDVTLRGLDVRPGPP